MKEIKKISYIFNWIIIFILVIPQGIMAQDYGKTYQPSLFAKADLTQMLAPIALYPDSLIAQILMAATYPIEVVEAERWMKANENLRGNELDAALKGKAWDPSIKSLCHFPNVLYAMSEKLDQTTRLGDAFLIQQDEVMETIQDLRRKAREHDTLKTTNEQKVIVEREIIRIVPSNPHVIYVPIYDPVYVYGPWWYPTHPPYYWHYPLRRVYASGLSWFGSGFIVGISIASWTWCDWHHHHIYVDLHKTKRFHTFHKYTKGTHKHEWKHKPYHRRGVAYKHASVRQGFGSPVQHIPGNKPKAYETMSQDFGKHPNKSFRNSVENQARSRSFNRNFYQTKLLRIENNKNTSNYGNTKKYTREKRKKLSGFSKTVYTHGKNLLNNNTSEGRQHFNKKDTKLNIF